MANVRGRGVRVEVAATYASPLAITSVSQASPGVATKVAHGLLNGAVGYFTDGVAGMAQLRGQAIRVANKADDTFELQGLNTTNFSAFTSGNVVMVSTWETLAEARSYSVPNAESEKLDATTLLDIIKVEEAGLLGAQSITVNVLAQTFPSAAQALIDAAAQSSSKMVIRVTLHDGSVRVFYGEPSLPGEDVQSGQLGTGAISFAGRGFVLKLPA